jgi:trehalose-6-phosphatase
MWSKNKNKSIAIDFDGVIHRYSKDWHDGTIYDFPQEGAIKGLKKLSKKYNLIIYTCRKNKKEIQNWLKKYNFNNGIEIITNKPKAVAYIDDKAIRFSNWDNLLKKIAH